jgi:hypothetical protein
MKYQRTTRGRPNSLLVWQGGSGSGEGPWTERENRDLIGGGFESASEGDDLWSKDGVWFGRNAALQNYRAHAAPGHRQSQRRLRRGGPS